VHRLASSAWQNCVARKNGAVVCWGVGALHDIPAYNTALKAAPRPATIANLNDTVEVAVDSHDACALRKNGSVACWGTGKLPGGVAAERAKATEIAGLIASRVFAAHGSMCAIAGNDLACFGATITRKKLPVPGAEVIDVAGGRDHACLVTSKGAVHCWGANSLGALGGQPNEDGFARVPGIDDAIAVSTGANFSCAIHASGYRSCWGNGQPLGGGYSSEGYPIVTSRARNDVTRVAAERTTCWLLRGGSVFCQGDGKYGQLGTGTTSSWGRDNVRGLSDALELAVGFDHVCALRANDDVVCWGANERAQLGDGTVIDRTVPTGVLGLGGKEPPPAPKLASGAPILPSMKPSPTPSWREPEFGYARRIDSQWRSLRTSPSSVGVRAALFEREGKAFHEDHGVIAIAWPKDHKFLALDGDDAVWVGTKDAFLRAADVHAAKKGAFQKVLALPYAAAFDVSKGIAVAADSSTLHISRDGGKTFSKLVPKADIAIEHVYARGDGLIAIAGLDKSGEYALWIAKDGQTFAPSRFQPKSVGQMGSYLYENGCPGAILSSDGVTWNAWEEEYGAPLSFDGWGEPLVPKSWPRAITTVKMNNLIDPPAPAPSAKNAITGKPGVCNKGSGGVGMGGGGRGHRRSGACVGAACIRGALGPEPKETATEVGLYGDGACTRDEKGLCTKAPWKRKPHVAVNLGAPIDLPADCEPDRLLTAGGIGVLFCTKDDGTVVHTINKEGVFRLEAKLSTKFEVDDLTIASDGTLVAHPNCGSKTEGETGVCPPALIRAPKPLGASDAWRPSTAGFAYRVLPGGAALVIAKGSDVERFSLFVDAAGAPPKLFAKDLPVLGDLLDVELAKEQLVVTEQITTRKPTKWYVAPDGLVAIP